MAQLPDCSSSLSHSCALSCAATDRRVVRCVLLLRFFAACCFRMLIYFFFRFLFWRPPKQRPSALVFSASSPTTLFFFRLHTLLLVYRTKFFCLPAHCRLPAVLPPPPTPPPPLHPLPWRVLTATSDEFCTPTQRQLLPCVLSVHLLPSFAAACALAVAAAPTQFGPVSLSCCCLCSVFASFALTVCAALSSFQARSCQCGDRIELPSTYTDTETYASVCEQDKSSGEVRILVFGGCTETLIDYGFR